MGAIRKHYTLEEDNQIKAFYRGNRKVLARDMRMRFLAKSLGRSVYSIWARARLLKIANTFCSDLKIKKRYKINIKTGCFDWLLSISDKGYGQSYKKSAHKAAYEKTYGNVPIQQEIDHLCRNRKCVNSLHLEAATHQENIDRGNDPNATIQILKLYDRGVKIEQLINIFSNICDNTIINIIQKNRWE